MGPQYGLTRTSETRFKPIFHRKFHSRWLHNKNVIGTNNMKCTWPARVPMPGYPTRSMFHWLVLGAQGLALGHKAWLWLFRYQHVGIPNAKFSHWGSRPTRGPNAKGSALHWIIGFRDDMGQNQVMLQRVERTHEKL